MLDDDKGRIGSCTKSFTATIMAMLIEKNTTYGSPTKRLMWSTKLKEVFPLTKWTITAAYQDATILNVFNMQGGFPREIDDSKITVANSDPKGQRAQYAKEVLKSTPANAVGNGTALYSNAGYILMGHVIDIVTNSTWEAKLQDMILTPMGLSSAALGPIGVNGQNLGPYGHKAKYKNNKSYDPIFGTTIAGKAPAGDLHMTAKDHSAWVAWHTRGRMPGGAPSSCPCLGAGCLYPCLTTASFNTLHAVGTMAPYGAGFYRGGSNWAGLNATLHNGAIAGWYAEQWVMPDRGLSISVMTNHWRRNQTDNSSIFPFDLLSDAVSTLANKYALSGSCSSPQAPPYTLVFNKTDASCMRNTVHKSFTRCSASTGGYEKLPAAPYKADVFLDCAKACVADTMCLAWRFISLKNATNYTEVTSSGRGCRLIYRFTSTTGISTGRRLRGAELASEGPGAGGALVAVAAAAADDDAPDGADETSSAGLVWRRGLRAYVAPAYTCVSDSASPSVTSGEAKAVKSAWSINVGVDTYEPYSSSANGLCVANMTACSDLCLRSSQGVPASGSNGYQEQPPCRAWTWNAQTKQCFMYSQAQSDISLVAQAPIAHCILKSGKVTGC
ncbi:hypothetical protein HYH02_011750 [Chlamydomonas schloesseri]|uniref:Beta-lactamase-related domain-containing protein n=1 Tax=Chlamydomonas schloesseri TaxID=2026947 RepID=A0A835T4R6_9CHLO|nr:hypothetical protein HYH02_011750 [Chlamydomonas schloesseri]|eukprot:KAG2436038.1 hypothetical protein HYH02_011750 [Chlamydomonas schloesseri]